MINRVIYRDMREGAIIKWKGNLYKRISRKHQFQRIDVKKVNAAWDAHFNHGVKWEDLNV